jgi:alpha-ketoglutarate-dependent taurine dioxygenase
MQKYKMYREMVEKEGFAVITDHPPITTNERLIAFVRALLGYDGYDSFVRDVRYDPSSPLNSSATCALPLHTDIVWEKMPPRYLTLVCLAVDQAGGGVSRVVNAEKVLSALDSEVVAHLTEESVVHHCPPSDEKQPSWTAPIISRREGEPLVRISSSRLINPSPSVLEFLRVADSMAHEVALQPGWMLVVDNWRTMHARTELLAGEGSKRWYKRRYRW